MRKILAVLLLSIFANFANAEMLLTLGKQMGDDQYEGVQIGMVQPLTEFDASVSYTELDDGSLITIGAQKGMEIFPSTMLYGFIDLNKFFWDKGYTHRPKTEMGYGAGVSIAVIDPIFVDLRLKKFEETSKYQTYVGIAYFF